MGADDLELIPRGVRDKLDRVGIKLHLGEWQALTLDERRVLVDRPCESPAEAEDYRAWLVATVEARSGRTPDRLSEHAAKVR